MNMPMNMPVNIPVIRNRYIGKHEPHEYRVSRMRTPNSGWEVVTAVGKQELRAAANGCWKVTVRDIYTGKVFDYE